MGIDVFGCIDGFEVSFKNMSKRYSCESNLPSMLGESDKPNSDMKCQNAELTVKYMGKVGPESQELSDFRRQLRPVCK